MRSILLSVVVTLLVSLPAFGQQERQDKGLVVESGTRIEGQLQNTLDVDRAQVGDQIVLKTTKAVKQQGRTVVEKGSKLIGRVTEVQKKDKSGASRLGLLFDRLEGVGLNAPIEASVVSIANTTAAADLSYLAAADVFGLSRTSSSGKVSPAGGGLLGGVTSTATGIVNNTVNTVGDFAGTATQTAGTINRGMLNGLQISNAASGVAEGGTTLSSADRNIRLEKGTRMQLQLNGSVRTQ